MAEKKASLILQLKDNASKKLGIIGKGVKKLKDNWIAVTAALAAVGAAAFSTLKAFGIQERAVEKLRIGLGNVKTASKDGADELIAYAASLEKTTTFGDEQIITAQAMLSTFQLNEKQIKAITPRMLDMASASERATGEQADLQQIAIALGKGFTGQIGILGRYGVVLDKDKIKAEGFNGILTSLDDNFKGMAEGSAKTMLGRLSQLQNNFGTLKEEIGELLSGPAEGLIAFLGKTVDFLRQNREAFAVTLDVIIFFSEEVAIIFEFLGELIGTFAANMFEMIMALGDLIKGDFKSAFNRMKSISIETALSLKQDFLDTIKNSKKAWDDIQKRQEKRIEEDKKNKERLFKQQAKFNLDTTKENLTTDKKELTWKEQFEAKKKAIRDAGIKDKIGTLQTSLSTIATLQDSSSKTLFAIGKAAAIANAIINTAMGISKALSLGPIIGIPLAALIGAAGAIQIAKISAQGLQEGGIVLPTASGTLTRIGEGGSAEAVIPLDDDEAQERLGESLGGLTININAGTIIADDTSIAELAEKIDEQLFALQRNRESVSI